MFSFEAAQPMSILPFFQLQLECFYSFSKELKSKHLLPSTASLSGEEDFAKVFLGWSEEAIYVKIQIHDAFEEMNNKESNSSDYIELFFDTRDIKSKSYPTSFCHHFIFYPQKIGGFYGKEVTRFRGEDIRKLSEPQDLTVVSSFHKSSYEMQIAIPAKCLFGFDTNSFQRLGSTYCIHKKGKEPQFFSVSPREYSIERYPSLWCSLQLVK